MKRSQVPLLRLLALPFAALLLMANGIADRAEALMGEGKEAEAFALVEREAENGDPEAVNYLAWFFDNGRHVAADRARAASLYREAAELGVPYAQWRLGVMIDTGETPGEAEEAIALFEKAAAQNFTNAMTSLAVMHATGRGTERDPVAARFYYSMAAAAGNPHAIRGLGVLYLHGEGVDADPMEAAAYFLIAAGFENEEAKTAFDVTTKGFDEADMQKVVARANELLTELGFDYGIEFAPKPGKNTKKD